VAAVVVLLAVWMTIIILAEAVVLVVSLLALV
jgi:hypothetical protein